MIARTFGLIKIHKYNAFEEKKEVIKDNRNTNNEDKEDKATRLALSLSKQTKDNLIKRMNYDDSADPLIIINKHKKRNK